MVRISPKHLFLLTPFLLSACSGGDSGGYEPKPDLKYIQIELTQDVPAVHQGEIVQISATIKDDDPDLYTYQWEQIDTTGIDALNPVGMDTREFSFTAPEVTELVELRFAVAAKEDGVQLDRAEVIVQAYPNPLLSELTIDDEGLRTCLGENIDPADWPTVHVNEVTELTCATWASVTLEGAESLTGLGTLKLTEAPDTVVHEDIAIKPLSKLPLLKELELSNTKLASFDELDGVSYAFPYLEILRLSGNELETVSWIGAFLRLVELNIDGSLIDDIAGLSGHPKLETLFVGGKEITEPGDGEEPEEPLTIAGIAAAANMPELTTFGISHANVESIESIKLMPKLVSFWLTKTTIDEIDDLGSLTEPATLKHLYITESNIGLDNINELELETLASISNGLTNTDLDLLSEMTTLISLDVSDNDITDLTALTALTNLTTLNLTDTTVAGLTPLEEHEKLELLTLTGTPLNCVQVDAFIAVTMSPNLTVVGFEGC
jgi:Leucine-rich repeat (LRR) protein